jgi:hypothetical protein
MSLSPNPVSRWVIECLEARTFEFSVAFGVVVFGRSPSLLSFLLVFGKGVNDGAG